MEQSRGVGSACNQVFGIPELLDLIIWNFSLRDRDLAWIARVSSSFHLPSIRRLWYSCRKEQFDVLVNFLPCYLNIYVHLSSSQVLNRNPVKDDLTRFRHYSNHIHIPESRAPYPPEVHSALGNHPSRLFPYLEAIILSERTILHQPNANWTKIMGPNLKKLRLTSAVGILLSNVENKAYHAFFEEIPNMFPLLEELTIPFVASRSSDDSSNNRFVKTLCQTISFLTRLKSIKLVWEDPIPGEVVRAIASHSIITKIDLNTLPYPSHQILPDVCFPSLTDFALRAASDNFNAWVDHIKAPELLRKIRIEDYSSIPATFTALPRACNLTTAIFEFEGLEDQFQWSYISPLLMCHNVSKFDLSVNTRVEGLNDTVLINIACCWKNLSYLSIEEYEDDEGDYYAPISFVTLAFLVNACSQLEGLQITVSMDVERWSQASKDLLEQIEAGEYQSLGGSVGLCLNYTRLRPGRGQVLSPKRVARIIGRIWPEIVSSHIRTNWHNHGESWPEGWDFVRDLVEEIVVQGRERKRAAERELALLARVRGLEEECGRLQRVIEGERLG